MAIAAGTRLGPYEILSVIGAGRGDRLAVGRNRHSRRDTHPAIYLTDDLVGAAVDAVMAVGTARR